MYVYILNDVELILGGIETIKKYKNKQCWMNFDAIKIVFA